ncbi:MAG: prepilin-type N-terminal cleavage/methylation domain-containing protein [Candidatus Zixiibacteriota bacterium]
MLRRCHSNRGFTLIELMIVVVIIGILAALAIPRFKQASTKAKQAEPQGILKLVYTMQHAQRQETATYADAGVTALAGQWFPTLGIEIPVTAKYTYQITVANANQFTAVATIANPGLDDDPSADQWQIDQTGALTNPVNDVIL